MRKFAPLLMALALLAGCRQAAEPALPAMWEVTGPKGEHGWLFGTIHVLSREADWRSPVVNRALDGADMLVLEIATIDDDERTQQVFQSLARSSGLLPLSQRVDPALRPALMKLLANNRLAENSFDDVETWAAALTLAQLASKAGDASNGVDRALLKAAPQLQRAELEGARGQLSIFDRMPEDDQRDLLHATLRDDPGEAGEDQLAQAWRKGDMEFLAKETHTGMLADPGLRKALFLDRNLAWNVQIDEMLRHGRRPFVAVGAAHLAGADGLPAMMAAKGWKVVRIQ